MSMEQEIKKLRKNFILNKVFYIVMSLCHILVQVLLIILTFVDVESIVKIALINSLFIPFSIFLALYFASFIWKEKQGDKIIERYKKESEEKYGKNLDQQWTNDYYKKQAKIRRTRLIVFWSILITAFLAFIPFLVIAIIIGEQQQPLFSASVIIVIFTGIALIASTFMLIVSYITLKLKVYEIEGTTIIRLSFINGGELYVENKKLIEVMLSGYAFDFSLPNGVEVKYFDGIICKKEDFPEIKKAKK